jgi:hypothetical protein
LRVNFLLGDDAFSDPAVSNFLGRSHARHTEKNLGPSRRDPLRKISR